MLLPEAWNTPCILQEVAMRKTIWTPTLAWLAAASVAFMFAFAGPKESNFLGHVPTLKAKRLDQQSVVLPHSLEADRTLVLVAFRRTQRDEIDSWIRGLDLHQNSPIAWFKMPVLDDPGSEVARSNIESRLLERHQTESDRSRLVPVFTNREAFLRAAAMSDAEHAWVLVLNRKGEVLARAQGAFDQQKAEALRETLLARGD
jgi:hypothetical protein